MVSTTHTLVTFTVGLHHDVRTGHFGGGLVFWGWGGVSLLSGQGTQYGEKGTQKIMWAAAESSTKYGSTTKRTSETTRTRKKFLLRGERGKRKENFLTNRKKQILNSKRGSATGGAENNRWGKIGNADPPKGILRRP